jgi:hypothetical protein
MRVIRFGLPILLVMVVSGAAWADKAGDVTTLVKKNLDAMAAGNDTDYGKTLAKDAVLFDGNGMSFTLSGCKDCPSDAFKALYGEYASGKAKHKLGKLVVQVDDAHNVAWFQGPFEAVFKSEGGANPCGPPTAGSSTTTMRVSGVAVADGSTWKIAAVMYTHPMGDGDLIDKAKSYEVKAPGSPEISGDADVGKAVAAWFPKVSAAKTGGKAIVASGSAPGEYFDGGASVTKVAPEWDKLGLVVGKVDAHVYGGTVAFVHAETFMPIKKTAFAAPLTLAAIVVKEGNDWKWTSLQFAPGLSPW